MAASLHSVATMLMFELRWLVQTMPKTTIFLDIRQALFIASIVSVCQQEIWDAA